MHLNFIEYARKQFYRRGYLLVSNRYIRRWLCRRLLRAGAEVRAAGEGRARRCASRGSERDVVSSDVG